MDNLRGAALMTLAMFGFAVEDMFIKLMAGSMPPWQIMLIIGAGGAVIFAMVTLLKRQPLFSRAYFARPVLLRNLGEMVGTLGFVTALALIPLSQASAVLQATPLVVTLGAAVFLREPVGWRRWTAVVVGFLGVLLVIRPGTEGFNILTLWAVLATLALAGRDLATRSVPPATSSFQLSFLAFLSLVPTALLLAVFSDVPFHAPRPRELGFIACAIGVGTLAYYAIVAAMRVGEVSFVTPFRYSRLIFAMAIGVAVFSEHLDGPMLIGSAIIVGSGIYTVWRERKLAQSPREPLSPRLRARYDAGESMFRDQQGPMI